MANFDVTIEDNIVAVNVGENTQAAANSATSAAQSAAYASGFEAPEYASQSAGEAGLTTVGLVFRVPKGTTPETFDWYRIDAPGSSALIAVEREMTDNKVTVIGSVGAANDTNYPSEKAARDGIEEAKRAKAKLLRQTVNGFEVDIVKIEGGN